MLDRILYTLASPLAREIIDSLEREPGEWTGIRKPFDGSLWWIDCERWRLPCPKSLFWGDVTDGPTHYTLTRLSRLALRRAIKKWRKKSCG